MNEPLTRQRRTLPVPPTPTMTTNVWEPLSPFLTTTEVAHLLKVSRNTVPELCRRGEIKARRVGRQWRILKTDLDVYMGTAKPSGRGRK